MENKPAFDFKAENLDEKVIDEIILRWPLSHHQDPVSLIIGPFNVDDFFEYDPMTPEEIEEFEKRPLPKKEKRAIGPYDSIIRHLTALIGNKNLSDDHRLKYAEDRDYYKARQKEARSPATKRIFLNRIRRDQIHDLVAYIHGTHTLKESFELAAQIWNVKRNDSLTAAVVKYRYWNAYK